MKDLKYKYLYNNISYIDLPPPPSRFLFNNFRNTYAIVLKI